MKKKMIPIIIVLVIILGVVGFFIIKNSSKIDRQIGGNVASIVSLDTNIGYELYLDKDNNVIKYIKYNNSEVIKNKDTLENVIKVIKEESMEYRDEYKSVALLISNEGSITIEDVEIFLNSSDDIHFDILTFGVPNEDDKDVSDQYKISTVKAKLVNKIAGRMENFEVKDLVNKTVLELLDMDSRGYYCPNDYTLSGDFCIKEIGREEPLVGELCPLNYYEYNGVCYKIGEDHEGEKIVCRSKYTLEGEECILTETYDAEPVCEKGEFNGKDCISREEVGEAKEYCYDPNRYLYNHKCLATKPLLNGGCPGDENAKRNNRCVNFKDDMQDPSYSCEKGEALYPQPGGVFTCVKETKYDFIGYECDGKIQSSKKCVHTDIQRANKEKICINGSVLVDEDVCIIKSETTPKVVREYCGEHSYYKNGECIVYESIDAYRSE